MHLLEEQLGDVDDLVVVAPQLPVRAAEIVENVGLRYAEIDALQGAHVANVPRAANPDDGKDAQVVAVAKHCREVIGDLQRGVVRVRASGDDGDGVVVDLVARVDADADEVLTHLFDISRFILDGICFWVGPPVIDPTVAGTIGNIDHLPNEEISVLIPEIDQVFPHELGLGSMRHIHAVQIVYEGVKIAVIELPYLGGDRSERGFGSFRLKHALHALDHRHGFIPGTKFGSTDGQCRRNQGDNGGHTYRNTKHKTLRVLALENCFIVA